MKASRSFLRSSGGRSLGVVWRPLCSVIVPSASSAKDGSTPGSPGGRIATPRSVAPHLLGLARPPREARPQGKVAAEDRRGLAERPDIARADQEHHRAELGLDV